MNFEEYNIETNKDLRFPKDSVAMYLALGVNGEAGELGEKVKKVYRDESGVFSTKAIAEVQKEIGDVLWYLNRLSEHLGFTLESAAILNVAKLQSRIDRDIIHGSGDNR